MLRRISLFSTAVLAMMAVAPAVEAQATCGAAGALAASCSPAGTQVSATVPRIVRITVTPTAAALTAPTDVDFAAAGTVSLANVNLQTISIRANTSWALNVTATAWTAPYAKAVGDAAFSISGGAPYTAFSGASQAVTTGTATAGQDVNISYQVNWSLVLDIPGTYTLPVAYTLSST